MKIDDRGLDQAHSDNRSTHGGLREDHFATLYLQKTFGLTQEEALTQVGMGGRDYGIDAFHIDTERRNLYLFQFKWTESYMQFKGSLQRLIEAGMERIFGALNQDSRQNELLNQLKSQLAEDKNLVERVVVQFVFNGDPTSAENSPVLDKLREDLENKKYLIDQYFSRPVELMVEFRSAKTRRVGGFSHHRLTRKYELRIESLLRREGPDGEVMHVGFARLVDLHGMYKDMGQGFFERNIRGSLRDDEAPNRAINRSLRAIVLEGNEDPRVFAFNHNGVTLFAQQFESSSNASEITEPRLLNGAQTVTTFARFIDTNSDNLRMARRRAVLEEIYVPCRVITNATDAFVVAVTVSNNRQNPVMPWNLRANDMIQLELQEQFQFSLGIYYERQENAFANLSDANLEELGVDAQKAIELRRLAQTYLASDGEVDKMSRLPEVFENEKMYNQIFNESRLRADLRKVVLCYKIQFRLRRVIREILEKGEYKYAYIARGRNLVWALLCQALLNDPHTDRFAERFGRNMLLVADYTALLARLATTRVRFLIGKVAEEELYAGKIREERYDFLRSNAFHEKCMELAYKNWGWVQKRLK